MLRVTPGPVLPIFTTNYDRAIEELAKSGTWIHRLREEAKAPEASLLTGFFTYHEFPEFRPFHRHPDFSEWGRLLKRPENLLMPYVKLHGSLGWQKHPQSGAIVDIDDTDRPLDAEPVLLGFGEKGEHERPATEPFRSFDSYLEEALRNARVCVVVGFANRDLRIDHLLSEAVQHGTRLLFVLKDAEPPDRVADLIERAEPLADDAGMMVEYLSCEFGGQECVGPIMEQIVRMEGVLWAEPAYDWTDYTLKSSPGANGD